MNINLVTDAPKHNLALMKLSTLEKANGHKVHLNGAGVFDYTIGSWLFSNSMKVPCNYEGGPGLDPAKRESWGWGLKPDYQLFNLDFSLGYTWEYCPRKCSFCVVPKQNPPQHHHSIWTFHDSKFKKICLLNNNTFSDPQWKDTFEEIWDANLTVIDENGYDLRLMDEEKAEALKKTKFKGKIHYAWDFMKDEKSVLQWLKIVRKGVVYTLVGYSTSKEEDFYRCQKIHDLGHDPYIMPYNRGDKDLRAFKRFIDSRIYRKYPTIEKAWEDYKK